MASPHPPGLKRATLWRIALIAAAFAAGFAIYQAQHTARHERIRHMPYPMWQEMVRQQLIQPDLAMRMSLFAQQWRNRMPTELPGGLDHEYLYHRAVARYEVLVLDPRNVNPYAKYRLGIIYGLRGFTEQAHLLFLDAARHDAENEPLYLALARLFSPYEADADDLEGVLPHLQTLPNWLAHLTIPHYYARVGDQAATGLTDPTAEAADLRAEAELKAAAHQWGFGLRALALGAVVGALLVVSAIVILAFIWQGIVGTSRQADLTRARVPWHVPWRLVDIAEVLGTLLLALLAGGLLAGLALERLEQYLASPWARAALVAAQYLAVMLLAVWLMLWRIRAPRRQKLSVLGLHGRNPTGAMVFAGVAGYSIYLLFALVQTSIGQSVPLAHVGLAQLGMQLLEQQDALSVVIYLLLLGLIAPIVEELIFRGYVHGGLRRYMPVFTAVLLSSLVFALMHLNIMAVLQLAVIGIVLAVLFEYTRSLVPCIVCHALNNVLVFAVILLLNY